MFNVDICTNIEYLKIS